MRDPLRIDPVDQTLYLRHHFGADAVAGEKQQFVGRHDRMPFMKQETADARGVLKRCCADGKTPLLR
jgi:hypothetical protein